MSNTAMWTDNGHTELLETKLKVWKEVQLALVPEFYSSSNKEEQDILLWYYCCAVFYDLNSTLLAINLSFV